MWARLSFAEEEAQAYVDSNIPAQRSRVEAARAALLQAAEALRDRLFSGAYADAGTDGAQEPAPGLDPIRQELEGLQARSCFPVEFILVGCHTCNCGAHCQ